MLIKQLPKHPKRSRRQARAMKPKPPLAITGVVNVVLTASGLEVNLLVDTTAADPVETAGADPTKWTATYDNSAWTGASVEAAGDNELFIVLHITGGDEAPGQLVYAANPSDIRTASGRALGAGEVELV